MKKAHFCIDGFSFKQINDYYKREHSRKSRLNINGFESYLRYELAHRFGWACSGENCNENLSIEKHFYIPCFFNRSAKQKNEPNSFETFLLESGYSVHYANVASYASSVVITTNIDIFILLSTQGQFANLLREFKHLNIPTMLIGWEGLCKSSNGHPFLWRTDKLLIDFATAYCPLEKTLNSPGGSHPLAEIMFERFFAFSPKCLLSRQFG